MSEINPTAKLSLSPRQRTILEGYLDKRNISLHYQRRIAIVLSSFEGLSIAKISEDLSMSRRTASKWRIRWRNDYDSLCAYELQESPSDHQLLSRMLETLSDAPRSGAPPRISLSEKKNLVALACKKPREFNIPITRWNRELLAQTAMSEGLVQQISPRYVSEVLKKQGHTSSQE